MKKTILEIYALAVCFITVACFIVTLGIAMYNIVAVFKPDFTISAMEYSRFQNNDAFWNGCGIGLYCRPEEKKKERPSEAELTKQREEAYGLALANEQRSSMQTLVKCLLVLLVDAIAFAIHWKIGRSARTSAA